MVQKKSGFFPIEKVKKKKKEIILIIQAIFCYRFLFFPVMELQK